MTDNDNNKQKEEAMTQNQVTTETEIPADGVRSFDQLLSQLGDQVIELKSYDAIMAENVAMIDELGNLTSDGTRNDVLHESAEAGRRASKNRHGDLADCAECNSTKSDS